MQTTGNLGLKKPEGTDIVDIADLNGNMDILDNAVTSKVDKVTGKQLSTNDYTAAEKTKLAGIAAGANNYVHPNHTGDVTSTSDGVTAIAAGVIVDADVNVSAGIAWSKVSKTGASLADLSTRSAGDLSSGTLPVARLPAATGDVTSPAGSNVFTLSTGIQGQINSKASLATTPQQTTADITYYVRTDGNDNNTGLANTAAGAFKTINKAISMLPQIVNHAININVAAGTYAEDVVISGFIVQGTGGIVLKGAVSATTTHNILSATIRDSYGRVEIAGFNVTSTTSSALIARYAYGFIFTNMHAVGTGAQNGLDVQVGNGRVMSSILSNRANVATVGYYSQVFMQGITGTGNAIGMYSFVGSLITSSDFAADGGDAIGQGGIVTRTGVLNPWGDNTRDNRSYIEAGAGYVQTISGNVFTKVAFVRSYADTKGEYSEANARFTAKETGTYHVSALIGATGITSSVRAIVEIWTNGGTGKVRLYDNTVPSTTDFSASNSGFIRLSAGEYMEIFMFSLVSLTLVTNPQYHTLRITRIA
ncbi:hypothetical protein [Paenibacillus sp. FSL K6-2859]|uniref:hypothetical protein n=1 Tax=Paenibacillus sp. FSL K6-2859 TaxID=2921482 RepID=UPI0030F88409